MTGDEMDRRIIELLADLPQFHSLQRRQIQRRVCGTDFYGASHVAASLGRLKTRRLVVEPGMGRYRISEAGRASLALVDELSGGAA